MATPDVEAILRDASDEVLLQTFAALTHRLHAADRSKRMDAAILALDIREQRNEVQTEILRRMKG